jgi:L-cysteine S-thiosulfotransferase
MRPFPKHHDHSHFHRRTAGQSWRWRRSAVSAQEAEASAAAQGKQVAFDRRKGNCLACHAIEGGEMAGNIGPPLVAMKARFPDKARLRAQIWDSTKANPNSIMPPFGRHQVLSEKEIDQIVEYMYTL